MHKIESKNPAGHLVVGPSGQLVTLPHGQPLKAGWHYASAAEVQAKVDAAAEADKAEK